MEMKSTAAEQHTSAAKHYDSAAKHHREAAKALDAGKPDSVRISVSIALGAAKPA